MFFICFSWPSWVENVRLELECMTESVVVSQLDHQCTKTKCLK